MRPDCRQLGVNQRDPRRPLRPFGGNRPGDRQSSTWQVDATIRDHIGAYWCAKRTHLIPIQDVAAAML
jgi:hypothetical protein